ncbi:MAG: Ig-like domain-containing protein, partial [Lachnospiraceae bacterium]|nr:Ig-like domain-containing protein [Lachnospiraceae bacterium]
MRGKRRITGFVSIFVAVILCLTSTFQVSALETGDEILLNQGNGSETGSLIQADDTLDTVPDITSDDISEDALDDMSNNASDSISDNTSEISLYSTQDYADTDKGQEDWEADDDKTSDADTGSKASAADGTSAADNETSGNEEEDDELTDIVRVNPLYEDVVDESDIPLPPEESTGLISGTSSQDAYSLYNTARTYESAPVKTYNATSPKTYTTIADAAAYLRDCMEAHESEIRINIDIPSQEYGNNLNSLWDTVLIQAKTHSGKGTQGDSISYQYAGARGQYGSRVLVYYPGYYTTKEQENELTARVSQVLGSLNLEGCSDEVKIARIHKYITDHVVYDHANLNNINYKLKYTAYAALINGTAVCQGYSVLFYRMALDAGVDARVISGKGNGGDHAWNIVRINGKYYNLDSTWDAGKSPRDYGYYLNNSTFNNSHVRASTSNSGLDYTSTSFNRQYPMASSSLPYPESEKKHASSVKFVQGDTVTAGLGKTVTLDVAVSPSDAWDTYASFSILSGGTIGCSWSYDGSGSYVRVVPSSSSAGFILVRATTRDGNKTCDCKIVFRENTTPLAITKQPSDASGKAGDKVSFNITATGEGIKYLWQCSEDNGSTYKDLNSIWEGYNTASLKVPVTAARNGFKYRCVVTDVTGTGINSNAATLTVTDDSGSGTADPFVQTEITADSGQPGYLTQGYSMEVTGSVAGTNRDIVFTKVKGDGVNISKQGADAGRFRLRIDASGCKVAAGDSVEVVVKATVKNGKKDGSGKYSDYVNDNFYTVRVYPGSTLTFAPDTRKLSYTSPASVNTGTTGGRDNSAVDKDNQITAFTDCKGVFIKVWENEVKGEPVWSSSIAAKGGNSAVISGDSLVTALKNAGKLSAPGDFIFRIYPCNSSGKYNKNVYSDATMHIYRINVTGTGVVPAAFYGLNGQEIEIKASPADTTSLNWSDSSYWADDTEKKEGQVRKVTVAGDKTYTAVLSPVTVDVTKVTINSRDGSKVIKLETGRSRQLSATVEPSNATDKSVSWKSSNTDIVKIDDKGIITGVKEGEALITVTSTSRGLTDTCTVKVMDEVIEDDYVIDGQEVRMTANVPDGSSVKNGAKISLDCDPAAAIVYYTLDGTAPAGDYTGKNAKGTYKYSEPVTIEGENGNKVTVRARAVLYGYKSCEATFSYIVDDWGEIDDEGDDIKEKIPDSDPEKIPKAVWYTFKGDNRIYYPDSTAQTISVNKAATGGKVIFNNEISVFYGNVKLVEGRDYKVSYSNNVSPARAFDILPPTVILKGMGNYYKGSSQFCFTISEAEEQTDVSDIKIACLNKAPEYTGSRLTLDDLYAPDSKLGYNKVT